eukprot:UN10513
MWGFIIRRCDSIFRIQRFVVQGSWMTVNFCLLRGLMFVHWLSRKPRDV